MTEIDDISRELTEEEFDDIVAVYDKKRERNNFLNREYRLRKKTGDKKKTWRDKYPDYTITKKGQKFFAEKNGKILDAWTAWRLEQKIRHEENLTLKKS